MSGAAHVWVRASSDSIAAKIITAHLDIVDKDLHCLWNVGVEAHVVHRADDFVVLCTFAECTHGRAVVGDKIVGRIDCWSWV